MKVNHEIQNDKKGDPGNVAFMGSINRISRQAANNSGKFETRILNAEYNMGRFSALIEIIEGINTERFVSVADQTKTDRDTILKFIEKVYNIRAETKSWKQGSVGQDIIAGL